MERCEVTNKVIYPTIKRAARQANRITQANKRLEKGFVAKLSSPPAAPYFCNYCCTFHIGRVPGNIRVEDETIS